MKKKRLLYIEDEPYLARIVRETLELKGYEVMHQKDGGRILDLVQSVQPDLCILDVMLPNVDGFTLGGLIRNVHPRLPIIFLTAKTQTQDIVTGFASGGTDYIKKPFSMEELIARVENQVRLAENKQEAQIQEEEVALGKSRFFPGRYELQTTDTVVKLSHREAQVLGLLCRHRNQAMDRRQLLQMVWGDDSFFNSRNLDVYIRKLREYFQGNDAVEIITLKGVGYFFRVGG
jgi:DNA-binding response OmpR family regulator